ncbi:TPA: 50S ribosomal protein L10 [Candidatus Dependentiae bacterium]|nr:MAG: 50S ribosomal protein L10 [candidate division TM6 bacterium GW2011_GWE2_31_21]KKP54046.1 MAG: 50S ribosomal protein L10 [candidate division TM6 bacterium GW2011_GWF2_33_332]HBS48371.1 50S ribosomal protein L10 [Candidatus Dependentiae bacterium]HBZ72955.1 50S ribosomal protein L10 [Candidatus Dependentiae bacterium]
MNRQQKQAAVGDFKEKLQHSKAVFIVDYKGLTVSQLQDLRKKLRATNSSFKITKARLMKIASEGCVNSDDFRSDLKGQIGLVFAQEDVPPVAGSIVNFAKDNESLRVIAGIFEDKFISKQEINFLAALPAKDVLYARLAGVLISPMAKLAYVLKAVAEKNEAKES